MNSCVPNVTMKVISWIHLYTAHDHDKFGLLFNQKTKTLTV